MPGSKKPVGIARELDEKYNKKEDKK